MINILLNGCEWKKYAEKRLLKMFLTSPVGVNTLIKNISARSLTLLIFAVWWALCGRPQPEHELAMPCTGVTFFVKCFTAFNSILCHKTFSESGLLRTFYLFTSI